MLTRYVVKVPSKESFVTEIAFTFDRYGKDDAIIIIEHELFDALPDDSRVYIQENEDDGWEYKEIIRDCDLTVKDLRNLRKKFVNYI